MMDGSVREMFCTMALLFVVGYFGWWIARGLNDWGRNDGKRCEVGYNTVDGLCMDDRLEIDERCSAWGAPGFCWEVAK